MSNRYIAHLDMDAFYASVELLRYPHLRGQPAVVGGRRRSAEPAQSDASFPTLRSYTGRGVITTATYEARALGVHSGMGLMKAAKLAPEVGCCRRISISTGVTRGCSKRRCARWRRWWKIAASTRFILT